MYLLNTIVLENINQVKYCSWLYTCAHTSTISHLNTIAVRQTNNKSQHRLYWHMGKRGTTKSSVTWMNLVLWWNSPGVHLSKFSQPCIKVAFICILPLEGVILWSANHNCPCCTNLLEGSALLQTSLIGTCLPGSDLKCPAKFRVIVFPGAWNAIKSLTWESLSYCFSHFFSCLAVFFNSKFQQRSVSSLSNHLGHFINNLHSFILLHPWTWHTEKSWLF